MAKNTIEHDGIVTQVAETFIIVTIQSQTACAGCHAKGACGMSEMALKSITAEKPNEDVNAFRPTGIHRSFHPYNRRSGFVNSCRDQ